MFALTKRSRRQRILAERSIPAALWEDTIADIASLSCLDEDELRRLHDLALLFLHEKSLEPATGFELDDAMRYASRRWPAARYSNSASTPIPGSCQSSSIPENSSCADANTRTKPASCMSATTS